MGLFLRFYGSFRTVVGGRFQVNKLPSLTQKLSTSQVQYQQELPEDDIEQETGRSAKRIDVSPETSIRYMDSSAYQKAYGNNKVWELYRRNFKGQYPPPTRKTCIRKGEISTGNPCPICRDEYLLIHHKNLKLLEQFISPFSGEILPSIKTGICQKQHKRLLLEVSIAKDYGFLEETVLFRKYTTSDYD